MVNRITEYEEQSARRSFEQISSAIRSELRLSRMNSLAREYPAVVLAIGAALGVAVGCWVKRR